MRSGKKRLNSMPRCKHYIKLLKRFKSVPSFHESLTSSLLVPNTSLIKVLIYAHSSVVTKSEVVLSVDIVLQGSLLEPERCLLEIYFNPFAFEIAYTKSKLSFRIALFCHFFKPHSSLNKIPFYTIPCVRYRYKVL